jgi:hypothetical protein
MCWSGEKNNQQTRTGRTRNQFIENDSRNKLFLDHYLDGD